MGDEGLQFPSSRRAMDKSIASLRSAAYFLFLAHLSELSFDKTKKSIILMNDAFIRVGDEGLASLVFTSFLHEPPTLPIAKHRDDIKQLSY